MVVVEKGVTMFGPKRHLLFEKGIKMLGPSRRLNYKRNFAGEKGCGDGQSSTFEESRLLCKGGSSLTEKLITTVTGISSILFLLFSSSPTITP